MAPPPTLSPGYNVAPPPPSPGYGVAPPPHSPGYSVAPPLPSPGGYSMPPPFHQTNYKSTSGNFEIKSLFEDMKLNEKYILYCLIYIS